MNEKVIEQIGADELGMAVDATAKFITDMLPQYAGLQVLNSAIPGVFVFVVAVFVVVLAKCLYNYFKDDGEVEFEDALLIGVPAMLVLFILLAITVTCLGNALGWAFFPEAKLLNMAIDAVN